MARRHVGRFTRGPRKATDWSASAALTAGLAVAASSAAIDEVFTPIVGGETLIRTRGMLGWESDQSAATEQQIGAYGICVVSEQAATVGITAVPHPGTDAAWGGWLYHTYFFSEFRFLTAAGFDPRNLQTMVVDSKAMRKIDEDDRLVTVVEVTGTKGITFFSALRLLSKVH